MAALWRAWVFGWGRWTVRVVVLLAAVAAWAPSAAAGQAAARPGVRVTRVSVHRLSGRVYEYYYVLSTGPGVHDRVGVHRVVMVRQGKPVAAPNGVFLVHGDGASFDSDFRLANTATRSFAVFLASKGIDVWGVDLGWALVPAGTKDLSFMRRWGLARDVNDVEKALGFARSVRAQTGSSDSKLTLLGYSRGGWIAYALLNHEAQERQANRNVRAFIPVDTMIQTNNSSTRLTACNFAAYNNDQITTGVYDYSHQYVIELGRLAQTAPEQKPPPIVSSQTGTVGATTNRQAVLMFGAAPFQSGTQLPPYSHGVAGVFPQGNSSLLPTGLRYSDLSLYDRALATASWFEPVALIRDAWAATCDAHPDRFDDHLKDVTVPVFYVGAGGGFGQAGLYSLTRLGSKNVSHHIVSFQTPAKAALDFGHFDLFCARDAAPLVWTPIYHWLRRHAK